MQRRQAFAVICALVFAGAALPAFADPSDAAFDALLVRYVVASLDGINRVDYRR